jgi:hypothetical protein
MFAGINGCWIPPKVKCEGWLHTHHDDILQFCPLLITLRHYKNRLCIIFIIANISPKTVRYTQTRGESVMFSYLHVLIQAVFYWKMQYSSGLSFAGVYAVQVYGKRTEGQVARSGLTNSEKRGDMVWYTVIPRLTKIIRYGITFVSRNLR